jgi:hypothetical protein
MPVKEAKCGTNALNLCYTETMTPRSKREGCFSGQDLRQHAFKERSAEVSAKQLRALRDHGFIRELEPGCWDRDSKDRLINALRLETKAKHLDRRSLHAFLESVDTVPAANLKANMLSVLAKMTAPARKMRRAQAALIEAGLYTAQTHAPQGASPTHRATMMATLRDAEPEEVLLCATAASHLRRYLGTYQAQLADPDPGTNVGSLRDDELLLLLTTLELAKPRVNAHARVAEQMGGDD